MRSDRRPVSCQRSPRIRLDDDRLPSGHAGNNSRAVQADPARAQRPSGHPHRRQEASHDPRGRGEGEDRRPREEGSRGTATHLDDRQVPCAENAGRVYYEIEGRATSFQERSRSQPGLSEKWWFAGGSFPSRSEWVCKSDFPTGKRLGPFGFCRRTAPTKSGMFGFLLSDCLPTGRGIHRDRIHVGGRGQDRKRR
jgi:hypothetical protein